MLSTDIGTYILQKYSKLFQVNVLLVLHNLHTVMCMCVWCMHVYTYAWTHTYTGTCKYTYGIHTDNKIRREKFFPILQTYVSDKVDETIWQLPHKHQSTVKSTYVLLCTTTGKEGNSVHQ